MLQRDAFVVYLRLALENRAFPLNYGCEIPFKAAVNSLSDGWFRPV